MIPFFETFSTNYKKNYLRNLIGMASADGTLDSAEHALIIKIGMKRGLNKAQISEIINDKTSHNEIFLPESTTNRMKMLFDLMQVIHADGKVDDKEVAFMVNLVTAFKLNPEIIVPLLLLFEDSSPSRDEWDNFVDFVNYSSR